MAAPPRQGGHGEGRRLAQCGRRDSTLCLGDLEQAALRLQAAILASWQGLVGGASPPHGARGRTGDQGGARFRATAGRRCQDLVDPPHANERDCHLSPACCLDCGDFGSGQDRGMYRRLYRPARVHQSGAAKPHRSGIGAPRSVGHRHRYRRRLRDYRPEWNTFGAFVCRRAANTRCVF